MSLRRNTFSAGRWATASMLARAALQIAQTMILARLLVPADFGLMAIAAAAYAIVSLFMDLGLSSALIHFPDPPPTALSTLYWLNLGAATLLMLVFMAFAWPLAQLYHLPALAPTMLMMSVAMPLGALGQQFRVMAEKELQFSPLAVIEIAAASCGFMAAWAVALLHGGVDALVASVLVTAATSSALAWLLLSRGFRPRFRFALGEVTPFLRYGFYRLGDTLFNGLHSQADVLVGSAIATASAMGAYTVPRDLTLKLANTVINPVVTRVGLPVMARVRHDAVALKSVYLQTLRMTASTNFPVYVGVGVFSNELVALLYGPQWGDAAPYLRIFAAWGLVRSTANPVGSLLYAVGRTRLAFWWNALLLVPIPALLWIAASRFGLTGLALCMLLIQLLLFVPTWRYLAKPCSGADFEEYSMQLLPPLACASGAGAAAWLSAHALPHGTLRLAVGAIVGGIVYLALSWIFNRRWLSTMLEVVVRRGS